MPVGRALPEMLVGARVVMGFFEKRLERKSRAKALNYEGCGGGRAGPRIMNNGGGGCGRASRRRIFVRLGKPGLDFFHNP